MTDSDTKAAAVRAVADCLHEDSTDHSDYFKRNGQPCEICGPLALRILDLPEVWALFSAKQKEATDSIGE